MKLQKERMVERQILKSKAVDFPKVMKDWNKKKENNVQSISPGRKAHFKNETTLRQTKKLLKAAREK